MGLDFRVRAGVEYTDLEGKIFNIMGTEETSKEGLEGMMLKLKLQYFGHLMRRVDSLVKTLMLGGIGGRRKRGQRMEDGGGWRMEDEMA